MTAHGALSPYIAARTPGKYTPSLDTPLSHSHPALSWNRGIPRAFINCLPSEILELVFLHSARFTGNPVWDQMPIVISQVCSRWRSIALRLSALWSSIHLPDTKIRSSFHTFSVWLERARDHGLRVILRSRQSNVVPTLSSIIHRCDYLVLNMEEEFAQAATTIPFVNASRLQSIKIRPYRCNMEAVDQICTNVHSAQHLKALEITSKTLSTSSPLLTRSWPRLASLTIMIVIPGFQFASIAQNFPQLTYLKIWLGALGQPNTGGIQFPKLETLFMIVPRHPMSEYFDVLSLPLLKSLYASWGYLQKDRNLPRSLDKLLSSSKYPLETLSLDPRAERDLRACLKIPSLRYLHELHLDSSQRVTDETAKLLLSTVPHLRSLSICACATSDGVVSSILASRFQHGRSAAPRSLKSASIDFWASATAYRDCHHRDEQVFDQLIEKGLDIRGEWIFSRKLRQQLRGM